MKKLFALAALVLGIASCQKDVNSLGVNVGEQETVVTVSLPEVTRANSAESGWENTEGTLRVIMQIFDENGNTTDAMRFDQEKLTYGNTTVNYNVRLVPGHQYTFVAWADQGTEGQYFNTSNLKNVTFVDGAWTAMNENIDAYTDTETVEAGNSIRSINLVLTRPFAKVRVVATDINAVLAQGWEPTSAVATYQETVPVSFNAFAGVVGETAPVANPVRYVAYNDQYTDKAGEMTLFADYLYVPTSGTAKFEFAINGVDNNGNAIAIRNDIVFNTPIPAVRNKLTTIKGDILTNGSNIKVEVDEEFEQPGNEIEVVEVENAAELTSALENPAVGEIVLQENITLDGTLTFGAAATRANTSLPGRNITIDGNGNTLKVTKQGTGRAIDFTKETNGASLTLKNLTIENNVSWIERIVNYNTNGTLTLENVKIVNAKGCDNNYAINLPGSSDNAKVVIKDSEIWANAICLNLWGENTVANITNSKLYVVDDSAAEGYSVVALNNGGENAAHNSIINVEGGEIKVKYEGEGETMPSSALRDATNGSEINISETTEIVGEVKIPVANVIYEGYNEFYSFTTLQGAIDKAAETPSTATVALIKDIESSEIITVSGKATIDGNGHTITSSAGRAINVSGATDVTIKNLNIVASGERAINVITDSKKVTIENVTATAANYTVNVAASAPNAVVAIKNSTLNGLCTINVASAGANVTVDGSTVNCNDNNTTAGESYAALCLNKAAVGAKIIATNSTINVTEGSDSTKGRNGAEDGEITINGSVEGVVVTKAVITYPGSDYYYGFQTIEEAVEFAKSKDVISLIRDVELTEPLVIAEDKNVVLDINGKKIVGGFQANSTTKHIYTFDVYGSLTIKDSSNDGSIEGRGNFVRNGATLTVNSGSIYAIDSDGGSAIWQYGGDVVINGGLIEQKAKGTYNFAVNGLGGTVTVNGGKIAGNHGAIATEAAVVVLNEGEFVCTGTPGMTDNVLYSYASGSITINGGTFTADNDGPAGGCCVYDANGGVTINGGEFGNSSGGDVWGTTGTTIKGGKFENLIETSHIAEGYEMNANGEVVAK